MAAHQLSPETSNLTPPTGPHWVTPTPKGRGSSDDQFGAIVRDLMTRKVVTVEVGDTLRFAATLLSQKGISGMPVLGKDGQVVGVLSEKDIAKALRDKGGLSLPGSLFDLILEPSEARQKDLLARCRSVLDHTLVSQVMTTPAKTIGPNAPSLEAAKLMLNERINRLPVVEHGKLVGIVTRKDVLAMSYSI
ncbi:MAG TPA: CBS domain-containing protein [Thermoplasmata archaeon]|nr:CBS domain-containing protein [Thermoplasmata archaeon]